MIAAAVGIAQERAVTLVQIVDQMAFLFVDEDQFEIEPESWERVVATERIGEILDTLAAHLETCEWTHDAVDFRGVLTDLGLSKKQIRGTMGSCYAVVEGIPAGCRSSSRSCSWGAPAPSSGSAGPANAWDEVGAGPLT